MGLPSPQSKFPPETLNFVCNKKYFAISPLKWDVQLVQQWKNVTEVSKFSCELCVGIVMCKMRFFLSQKREDLIPQFKQTFVDQSSWRPSHLTLIEQLDMIFFYVLTNLGKTLEFTPLLLMKLMVFKLTSITLWNSDDIFFAARLPWWRKQCVQLGSGAQSNICLMTPGCLPFSITITAHPNTIPPFQAVLSEVVHVGSFPQKHYVFVESTVPAIANKNQ